MRAVEQVDEGVSDKGQHVRMGGQVLVTQLAAKAAGYADVVYLDAKTDTFLEEVSSCNIFAVFGRTIKTPPLQARAIFPLLVHCAPLTSCRLAVPWMVQACMSACWCVFRTRVFVRTYSMPLLTCSRQRERSVRYLRYVGGAAQGTILPGVTRKSIIQLARQLGYDVEEADVSVREAMQADEVFTTGTAVVVSAVGSLTYQVRRAWKSCLPLFCCKFCCGFCYALLRDVAWCSQGCTARACVVSACCGQTDGCLSSQAAGMPGLSTEH
jgi:hypothetical protein